jgi:hypothetical protein
MSSISFLGKTLSLVLVTLILFFSYITAVNNSSALGRQLIQAQRMQEEQKTLYNETVTEIGNYSSQSMVLSQQKGRMVPINRDSADFSNLESLQDSYSKQQSKDNPDSAGSSKSVLVK